MPHLASLRNIILILSAFNVFTPATCLGSNESLQTLNSNSPTELDSSNLMRKAKQDCTKMIHAFDKAEYDSFLLYVHPTVISIMGNKENLISTISKGIGPGAKILSTQIIKTRTLILTDSTIQCVLDISQVIKIQSDTLLVLGSTIGISYNGGESWYFINVGKISLEELRAYIPEIHPAIGYRKQRPPIKLNY